jgi:Gene product 88
MNFKELLEGAEPSMPGAPSGIKIMTPQQFVAKAGDMPDEKDEELKEFAPSDDGDGGFSDETLKRLAAQWWNGDEDPRVEKLLMSAGWEIGQDEGYDNGGVFVVRAGDEHGRSHMSWPAEELEDGLTESQLSRIRSLSGLGEATKLPAQTRDLDSQEFQDYMKRIVGTPDLDKSGNVKIDKKGNEKYTTGKTKGDKYKMPYIHRSSVVTYLSPDGKTYDEDAVKQTLAIRPKSLLKQNEKMKHSNGEFEQFFNVGFAALVGIALDEQTNKLIIVNTCPGAGSCKVECFAMKGGKIQFKAAWQSDGRILTYLLNDPDGFFNQLSSEISREASAAAKGDKKFPNGWQTTVRWHDAGDFFSPEYLDMALKMAAKHPDVKFYAYTKMAGAALADKPDNFIINWSEGANTAQEKQIKAQDPNLDKTKNSRIVPEKLFYDLLAKDEKGNLKKTADGAWQPEGPEALKQMKERIAKEYGISANSILSYTEYMAKRNSIPAGMKYNVIVAPGEGDVSANDPGVLSTLLLRH